MNDKTFTNLWKSKILKYLLLIKNENIIHHRRTFKNSYSSSWKLIVLIDFNVLIDLIEHNIRCIIFFRFSRKKMHFASIDKDETSWIRRMKSVRRCHKDVSNCSEITFELFHEWIDFQNLTIVMKILKWLNFWHNSIQTFTIAFNLLLQWLIWMIQIDTSYT